MESSPLDLELRLDTARQFLDRTLLRRRRWRRRRSQKIDGVLDRLKLHVSFDYTEVVPGWKLGVRLFVSARLNRLRKRATSCRFRHAGLMFNDPLWAFRSLYSSWNRTLSCFQGLASMLGAVSASELSCSWPPPATTKKPKREKPQVQKADLRYSGML
jgi:hypothetical protein